MKINSPKIKLIGVVLILSFVVAVAGCTEKTESTDAQTAANGQKVETAPQETTAPSQHIQEGNFKTYNSIYYNIDYPAGWTVLDLKGGIVSFGSGASGSEDTFAENLGVVVDPENLYTNVDQVVSLSLVELKKTFNKFVLSENKKITLAGQPAVKIVYTYEDTEGVLIKNVQVISIKNSKDGSKSYLFVISYVGQGADFDKYWPDAQKMIDSFVMK